MKHLTISTLNEHLSEKRFDQLNMMAPFAITHAGCILKIVKSYNFKSHKFTLQDESKITAPTLISKCKMLANSFDKKRNSPVFDSKSRIEYLEDYIKHHEHELNRIKEVIRVANEELQQLRAQKHFIAYKVTPGNIANKSYLPDVYKNVATTGKFYLNNLAVATGNINDSIEIDLIGISTDGNRLQYFQDGIIHRITECFYIIDVT